MAAVAEALRKNGMTYEASKLELLLELVKDDKR